MKKIKSDMILFHNFRESQSYPSSDLRFALVTKDDINDVVESGTIHLGNQKDYGGFKWHDTNPQVKLKL